MSENRELKVELINQLSFLMELQEKVWRYHPNNPNSSNVVDEYAQLQIEIDAVEEQLDRLKR